MKITFLVSGNVRSNFSYRALALAKALHTLGHEISIIAPNADKYNNFISESIHSIDGIKILQPFQFATKRLEINLIPYLFGAAKMVLQEKSDLVYIYKPTPISIVGFVTKLFRRTPVIVDMDDLGSEVMRIENHPWYQRQLVQWSEKIALNHADRLVVASSYLFDKYRREFPKKPMHIMSNGIESDWITEPIPSEEKKRIVFLGSINRKSILKPLFDVLPEIIKKHPDVKVLIMGDGQYLEYFRQKAKDLKISSHVTFTGWLEITEARLRLRTGDIGYTYMPDEITIKAASNMKVPQYMSRGVVPFVSNIGDLPAAIDFGKAGYICEADNIEVLKKAILHALEDKDRLKKAQQAHILAGEKFNWDNLALAFYNWLDPRKTRDGQRIYIVATALPGDVGGGEIRNYNLIKQLIKQGKTDVEVFCISSKDPESAQKEFESKVNAQCHIVSNQGSSLIGIITALFWDRVPPFMAKYKLTALGDTFREACEKSLPDVIHIEQLQSYYCIRPYISWLKKHNVKIVFDCHNIEFQSFDDSLEIFSLPKRLLGKFLVPGMKKMEIEAAGYADAVLACSASDANFFKQYNSKTYVVPNGVDCSEFQPLSKDQSQSSNLIFMGSVEYPPNGDAVQFYLSAIHPKVKEQAPNTKLLAIGTDRDWLDTIELNDESVEPLGFVEDVRPYLQKATIGICPIRYGSGTRIKIMTYMAAGLPVVSTSKGAEGVTYTNGHDIIITDDSEAFAQSIIKLLNDQPYRNEIARNGREFILQNYDWNIIGKDLAHIYQNELR